MTLATRSSLAVILLMLAQSPGSAQQAKPIIVNDQLTGGDAKDTKLKASPARRKTVELRGGVLYVLDLKSKDFDAYLRLEDPAGKPLAEDDDSGGGFNARLFFIPPKTAAYTVIATSFNHKVGKYRWTVQEAHLPATPLKLKQDRADVKGTLTLTGPRSPFSPHNSSTLYRVELKAGKTYVLELSSAAFDAYLSLADATLRQLASDDDSGGKRNARIRFMCKEAGTYYVVATGLGQPEGGFELKLHAE
jgi:hypothetical protein